MRGKKALLAMAVSAAAALALALPANAQPSGTIVHQSNLCIVQNNVGFCLNDTDGTRANNANMQMWQREAEGEPNNDWSAVRIGYVTSSWPWPATLQGPGAPSPWDQEYLGAWVVMLVASPYNTLSNYCAFGGFNAVVEYGNVGGYSCNSGALNQMWVMDGHGHYINVRDTEDATNSNAVGVIVLTGAFSSGVIATVDPYGGYSDQNFGWYPRF